MADPVPGRILRLTFDYVSAVAHPQYYQGKKPCVQEQEVPDEHWTTVDRVGDAILAQHRGLMDLIARGELIRNVHLFEADIPPQPQWREVTS